MKSEHIDGVVICVCVVICVQDVGRIKAFPYQVLEVRE